MKRKLLNKRKSHSRKKRNNTCGEDTRQRKKYTHGGRIEAYTWGEL